MLGIRFRSSVEALPGGFLQEPHGRVERRPAPHLHRKHIGHHAGHRRRRSPACRSVRSRVASSDWWASRKVVSVISSGFCSSTHCANFSGPSSCSICRVPGRRGRLTSQRRGTGAGPCVLSAGFLHQRVAVDHHFAQILQQLRRPIAAGDELKQLGRFVDESRRALPGQKLRMRHQVDEERECSSLRHARETPASSRSIRREASWKRRPRAETFTSSES